MPAPQVQAQGIDAERRQLTDMIEKEQIGGVQDMGPAMHIAVHGEARARLIDELPLLERGVPRDHQLCPPEGHDLHGDTRVAEHVRYVLTGQFHRQGGLHPLHRPAVEGVHVLREIHLTILIAVRLAQVRDHHRGRFRPAPHVHAR